MLPIVCPHCNSKLKWTVNKKGVKVNLYCSNNKCTGANIRQITHFFKVLTADFITETTVKNMMKVGFIDIPDILTASAKRLSKIDGFADKRTKSMLLSLKKLAENISLTKLAYASGIFSNRNTSIGDILLDPIITKLGRKVVLEAPIDPQRMKMDILSLPNMGEERAKLFVENLTEFRKFYKTLKSITLAPEGKRGKLTGKIFCYTGFREAKQQLKLEENGATVKDNLSKNVDVLFAAGPSAKTDLADKYGIKVVLKHKADAYIETLLK